MSAVPLTYEWTFGPPIPKTDAQIATWSATVLRGLHSESPGALSIASTLDQMAARFIKLQVQHDKMVLMIAETRAETSDAAARLASPEYDNVP